MFDIKKEVLSAEKRIRSYIRETPLDFSDRLSHTTGCNVYLKCENLQYTNSFKVRGAMSKLLSLTPAQREQGVVTASSGNHGTAVAYGCNKLNIHCMVFLPQNASSAKVDNIRSYHATLEFFGTDTMQAELHALEYAAANNKIYVPPYNDLQVIAGQGTIGLEITQQLKNIDAILIPLGGGGLISGIAGYVKAISPETKIIGCLPKNSPVMYESIKAGKIIDRESKPTLSDGTAGGLEPNSITFDICRELVDDYILVSEKEIKNAILTMIKVQHTLVEGAAAVPLAALLKQAVEFQKKNIVIILSGANISLETLKKVLC